MLDFRITGLRFLIPAHNLKTFRCSSQYLEFREQSPVARKANGTPRIKRVRVDSKISLGLGASNPHLRSL